MKKTISRTQLILTTLSVTALMISNITAVKQFQLPFGFTMTGAVIVFPITYILSDLFSEVYGYKWSRFTSYLAFAANILMVFFFWLTVKAPAPDWWSGQEAVEMVLGNTPQVLCASLAAFLVGDLVNDKVFRRMKAKRQGMQGFSVRAIVSSFCGEIVDSLIFTPIAFFGVMSAKEMLAIGVTNVILKTTYEIIIVPVTAAITKKVAEVESE